MNKDILICEKCVTLFNNKKEMINHICINTDRHRQREMRNTLILIQGEISTKYLFAGRAIQSPSQHPQPQPRTMG